MTGRGLGEFGRIRRFFAPLAGPGGLGLKDDAALVDCAPGHRLVVTVDAIVEGVHYLTEDPPDLVARKLLRVNLSDLAAMGARPLHYLLATALPVSFGEDQLRFGIDLLGGDSVATSGPAVLSLTAIGEAACGAEIRRSGANPGDRIWVSGTIGDAFLGLQVLRGCYPALAPADRAALTRRFQLPEPRTELGPRLAGIAHAMLDVSDGLLADLGHICDASRTGATVALGSLPLSAAARRAAEGEPDLAVRLAAAGDDYELLFAASPEAGEAIGRLAAELGFPITAIGTIEDGPGVRLVDAGGNPIPVATAGYRHF
jgi:thiamine-monophosphate kinase